MASHKLLISYDDATGVVTASHRCTVAVGGYESSHARDVELAPGAANDLRAVVDVNRGLMEAEATRLGIDHAAAAGRASRPGIKLLSAGGRLGGTTGTATPRKE